jgi:hypothetical protein
MGKMKMNRPKERARDIRLLIAILLFLVSIICALIQAWILRLFIDAAVLGQWAYFSETFSVQPPVSGPNEYCFDYCAADLPFLPGWIAVASFLLGLSTVVYSWWKPRPPGNPDDTIAD